MKIKSLKLVSSSNTFQLERDIGKEPYRVGRFPVVS